MTTTFPRAAKPLKGAIVGVDIFNPVASIVVFQYNPESISRSLEPQFADQGGDRTEALRLKGPPVETIDADSSIIEVLERFLGSRYRRFPVVSAGRLVGVISRRDALRALADLRTPAGECDPQ